MEDRVQVSGTIEKAPSGSSIDGCADDDILRHGACLHVSLHSHLLIAELTFFDKLPQKKNVYIKLAEAVSMRCEEKLRGRSEYPITNTDMVHPP